MFNYYYLEVGNADFLVALHHNSIVSLVVQVGRAVDVVHFHTRSSPGCGVAVHLARVGHEDQEAVILLSLIHISLLLKQRIHIEYLEHVYVKDEKTQKKEGIKNQRKRWIAAQFDS